MPLMPDLDLIKTLSPLGVGGLLAVVIFIFYRLDFLRERQNHVAERERQARREERWPRLSDLSVRFHGSFAYVEGRPRGGKSVPLFRLDYRSPNSWAFAIYRAGKGGYERSVLPSGRFTGTPEEALDCACGLYLADPSVWQNQLPPADP